MQSVMQISLEPVWYNTDLHTYMKKTTWLPADLDSVYALTVLLAMCLRAVLLAKDNY